MPRTSQPPQTDAEKRARNAFKRAEAAWQAATKEGDGTRAAELLLQKEGLHQLWKEEKARSAAAWQEIMQFEEEEERREQAAEAAKAALEERAQPPLAQAVEEAGDAPDDQLVDLLRTSMKEIRLSQVDASRPHEEGPGADLDLHGPLGPAEQGPEADRPAVQGSDAERLVQQGSGPP